MLNRVVDQVEKQLDLAYPSELVKVLLESYLRIRENWTLGRHEPSELNGGKFVEAATRMLQAITDSGTYVPFGADLNVTDTLQSLARMPRETCPESYRIHIPRALNLIYGVRSKRGVGHVGSDVNFNAADSLLILTVSSWALAEFFRLAHRCSPEDSQKTIDLLVQRPHALTWDAGNVRRVLLASLDYRDQTLLLLAGSYPQSCDEASLLRWTEHPSMSDYRRRVLRPLHRDRLVEYQELGSAVILPPGLAYVDRHYDKWLAEMESPVSFSRRSQG